MEVIRENQGARLWFKTWFWRRVKWLWHFLGPAQFMRGFGGFQVLVAGFRLGLFDLLANNPNRTLNEIRRDLGLPYRAARALLLACTSLGLTTLNRRRGTYRNSLIMGRFWSKEGRSSVVPSLEAFHELMYQPFYQLTASLEQGTNVGLQHFSGDGDTLYERLESHPGAKRVFYEWMEAMRNTEDQVPRRVIDELHGAKHLLDVGGGDGKNAIDLALSVAGLRVSIFDLPQACDLARRNVREAGLVERVTTIPGDFLEDPFPTGFDAILFAHIFNIYSADTNELLIRKCADALNKGNKLVIYNLVSRQDQSGPWHAAFMSLYFQAIATGEGFVYPPGDYEVWFRKAGFESLRVHVDPRSDEGIFVGTK